MESETDYTKYRESELVDMFGRMDPRWVPLDCARLKEFLLERGYIVRDGGGVRPGSAVPSLDKLQTLIGSPEPIECKVSFGPTSGLFRWLEPAHNDLGLVGSGTLKADGIYIRLSGRRAGALPALFGSLFDRRVELTWHGIADVESDENIIHFTYRTPDFPSGAITLGLPDRSTAERLTAVLPRERKADFRPQLQANVEFERRLIGQSPQTPATVGLVAINVVVFLAMVLSGHTPIAWGNFGPYTTDGEWWRLFTSLFLHFGVSHILFNMWALAAFGPLAERLYGSVNYLLIYLVAGVIGSLASISWRPDVISAGASGAIFGVLGALLAAQLRVGNTFPNNIVRPLRNSTLVFASCALLVGFMHTGVDNAAHLGGLAAGFLLGSLSAHPIINERSYARSTVRRHLQMLPLSIVLLAGGVWFAQRAAATLVGEGLYWHTIHWLRAGEHSANSKYNAALVLAKADKRNLPALADSLDKDVLPFWREASARLSAINLAPTSPYLSTLQLLQSLSEGRVHAYKLFAEGLRNNDPQEIATANWS